MGLPLAERSPNHRSTALRHSQSARPRAVTSPHRARPPPQGPAPSQRAGPTPPPTSHTAPPSQEHTPPRGDRKSTRLNSSHVSISYAVFCLKKKKQFKQHNR